MGMSAVHVWRLERQGDDTAARTKESWDGLAARLLPRTMRKSLQQALDVWLDDLKKAAEARRADAALWGGRAVPGALALARATRGNAARLSVEAGAVRSPRSRRRL